MSDLEELKQKWAEQDRRIDASLRLNRRLLTAVHLKGARSAMDRLTLLLTLHAAAWLAAIVALGRFLHDHWEISTLAVSAAAVDIYAIGMLSALIGQIATARSVDYAGPMAQIQARIEALRVLRIRFIRWAVLAGVVLWAPFMVLVCHVFLGFDLDSTAWLAANIAFGLLLIPLVLWASNRLGGRIARSPFLIGLMRDIAGHSLHDASAFLADLARFEAEEPVQ
jgi:hypothetical protein